MTCGRPPVPERFEIFTDIAKQETEPSWTRYQDANQDAACEDAAAGCDGGQLEQTGGRQLSQGTLMRPKRVFPGAPVALVDGVDNAGLLEVFFGALTR